MQKMLRWTGAIAALAGLVAAAGTPVRGAGLTIVRPRDGDTVREQVKVVIPRSAVPPNGFASLYVNGHFRIAQAPASDASKPITFFWDTKAKLTDTSLPEEQRITQDGEHVLEVRTYTDDGRMAERAAVNVRVANRVPIREGQPIRLAYRFRVGDATKYTYRYEMKASGTQNAPGAGPTAATGASTVPDMNYTEFSKVVTHVEDVHGGKAFLRERRMNPVTLAFGDVPQSVPVDESSRYFDMLPTGQTTLSTAMTRELRFPLYNQLYLPGRSVRVGDSWKGPIKIWAGALGGKPITIPATHTLEAVEWEHGQPAARIKSTYKGAGKLNLPYAGINDGEIEISGTSITHYSPSRGKILRAVHELDGTLKLDTNQMPQGGAPGGYGSPSPYGAPGGPGAPGYGTPGYGTPSYGTPGYGTPSGPPGGPPGYGGPSGAPGGPAGYGAPGGYPGGAGGEIYDPSANQGGPIPGVPVYATYSLKIRAVAKVG
jgi:hypothetical protein